MPSIWKHSESWFSERILNAEPNDTSRVQYHKGDSFRETEYKSSAFMGMEQSNTSVVINEAAVLKFFRRIYTTKTPITDVAVSVGQKRF